jgi:hypothetical protein
MYLAEHVVNAAAFSHGGYNRVRILERPCQWLVQVKMLAGLSCQNRNATAANRLGTNADDLHIVARERSLQVGENRDVKPPGKLLI